MKKMILFLVPMLAFASGPTDQVGSVGSSPAIEFEEVMRVDSIGGEDFAIWSGSMTGVDVAPNGHLFVTDSGDNRVLEFSADGSFIKQHGTQGNGPGEFQQLYDFRAIPGGGYFAFDNTQNNAFVHLFDENLTFQRRVSAFSGERVLQSAVVGNQGKYIAATWYAGGMGPEGTVNSGIIPLEGSNPLVLLSTSPRPQFDGTKVRDPQWFASFIGSWLKMASSGVGISAFDHQGNVYTANSNTYEITVYDKDLNKQRTIKHDYKPKPLTDADLDAMVAPFHTQVLDIMPAPLRPMITEGVMRKAIKLAEFPMVKQPIFGLLPMDNNHLMVVHDYNVSSGEAKVDLFDDKGNYLGNAKLPPISVNMFGGFFGIHTRMAFHNGHAYGVVTDEDGEFALVGYRYKIR